jgi:hypothetical protein
MNNDIFNSLFSAVPLFAIAADSSTCFSPFPFTFIYLRSAFQIKIHSYGMQIFMTLYPSSFGTSAIVPSEATHADFVM